MDAIIEGIAAGQHGVVARRQLVSAGVAAHAIDYRVRVGRLRVVHRGVYRSGPVQAPWAPEMAAVLACGDAAVLSHRSAAALWGFGPGGTSLPWVEVSTARGQPAPGSRVRVHRVDALPLDETTSLRGIPVTTAFRTLLDLAAVVGERPLEQAVAEAMRRGLATRPRLEALAARHPGRVGIRALRAVVHRAAPPAFTRSEAEERFLALVRRGGLAAPEVNVQIQGYEVDFLWRRARLVVEIDGFAFHASAAAFERDRRRDVALTTSGFRVLRFTWRRLTGEPEAVVARVARALGGARDAGWG